ncbi:hypothetical protein JTB14_018006 [Gonioctena quinquepunctata]|nr:hypothetical protein JTB14_018006 [Gonioctena quinquepunctata]
MIIDFGFCCDIATDLFEDNQGCIKLAEDKRSTSRTKHIDVRYHHLRDLINNNIIDFKYCSSPGMIADGLTKPLPKQTFFDFRRSIGILQK